MLFTMFGSFKKQPLLQSGSVGPRVTDDEMNLGNSLSQKKKKKEKVACQIIIVTKEKKKIIIL